jgi:DNA-binding beta-propeller fold protein YncE
MGLGRIVADPVRAKVYGITGTGNVVFIDQQSMSVEKVFNTGRVLRDIDVDPSGSFMYVLDNVTGEYWNQPPAVYALEYDLNTQSHKRTFICQAPLYQMAIGRPHRLLGVGVNQWVSAYQLDSDTGLTLSSTGAGYYGSTEWQQQTFVSNSQGTKLFRTELGISSIELIAFDTSTDSITQIQSREVGSYSTEPVFINSTNTSLYVGDLRLNPDNINIVLGMFPENIYAATGNNNLAFGSNYYYDPTLGTKIDKMPVNLSMMTIGCYDRYLYAFDPGSNALHIMAIPEPGTILLLATGALVFLRRKGQGAH